jgi:hypothetical protein
LVHLLGRSRTQPGPVVALATDEELALRASRDPHAFADLYARYLDPVHRYCLAFDVRVQADGRITATVDFRDGENPKLVTFVYGADRWQIDYVGV